MMLQKHLLRWPLVLLCVLLALSGMGAYELQRNNEQTVADAAQDALADVLTKTDTLLQRYTYGLISARGALTVTGIDGMSRADFARYSRSRDYAAEFPGARGIGFIRRVKPDQIEGYLESRQRAGWPEFKIHQLQSHDGERYVIELLEPLESNRQAIGLDIASEQNRRTAAQSAMRRGTATLTGPITLVQVDNKPSQSFLMLLPMQSQPGGEIVGWTYAPLVMDDILQRLDRLPSGRLTLSDVTFSPSALFYSAGAAEEASPATRQRLDVMGRTWEATFQPSSAFVEQLRLTRPVYAGAAGGLLAVLCSTLLAARLVDRDRKRRLHASQAQLAAMVDASVDAIIGLDRAGLATSWNPGAELIFGYPAAEALGRSLAALTVPAHLHMNHQRLIERVFQGEVISIAQTRRLHRNGGVLEVTLTLTPLRGEYGEVTGASATLRDISALMIAQEEVRTLNSSLEKQVLERTSELEAARRDLRTVLDAVPSMIGYWDYSQINRFANQAYGKWFGLSPADIVGKTMREVLGEELYELNRVHVETVLGGQQQTFERAIPHPDGSVRQSLATYLPDGDEHGMRGFYVIVHDVSDIVASRAALASALRENDVLVRTINEVMLYSVTDTDGRIIEVNNNFCAAMGYERGMLIGGDHRILRSGMHDAAFWAAMWETIAAGQSWNGVVCNRSADGTQKWFDTVISPYFNEHGAIERYVALRTDVTARVAADTSLRHISALLGSVLHAASEISIVATDPDGLITVFNSGAERMTGYEAADMVGLRTPAILHDAEEVRARGKELTGESGKPVEGFRAFVHVAEFTGVETREWTFVRRDGTRLPVSLSVTSMRDSNKQLVGYLGVSIDISQRKQIEANLLASARAAEQVSVAKSQFVANMSHEIRTPMNAVLGMLELMRRSELTASQRDHVDKATHAGKALLSLLNDVLDFSRIDAGKLELDPHPFEIELLLRELAGILIGNSLGKSVEVLFDIAEDVPATLIGDRLRIQQVLVNLAGNALKFTREGHVVIALEVLAKTQDHVRLRLGVRDTGIGIPPEQLASIFDTFSQADASVARRYGGSGLGLAISARLVGLMGSQLKVESEPGRGSCFWFDADFFYQAQQPVIGTEVDSVLNGARVLILDGNAESREILSRLSASLGCHPDTAANGAHALAKIRHARSSGAPFAALLMDMRMPEMNGFETAAILAADPELATPVIIVSAYAADGLRSAMGDRGATVRNFLGKPVMLQDLHRALVQAIRPSLSTELISADTARTRPLDGMRLLVVEDNELNRQVAFELLRSEGAIVDLAGDGAKGVAMATAPGAAYTAVLMDIQMPDVDGLEAARRLRQTVQAADLPILAMTANVSSEDVAACLAAGMDAHVAKPFDIDEVIARVREVLGRHVASAAIAPVPADKGKCQDVDFIAALGRMKGDVRLYRQMLTRFQREAQEFSDRITQPEADSSSRAVLSHAFRGLAMMVGADGLASRLLKDEQQHRGSRSGNLLQVDELRQLIRDAIGQLEADLAAHPPLAFLPEPTIAAPKAISFATWSDELLPLLETGNLRALDFLEERPPGMPHSKFSVVTGLVSELRFDEAARTIRDFMNI